MLLRVLLVIGLSRRLPGSLEPDVFEDLGLRGSAVSPVQGLGVAAEAPSQVGGARLPLLTAKTV
jgi:hypothetical protein